MEVKILLLFRRHKFLPILHNFRGPGDLRICLPYWQTPCTHFPLLKIPSIQVYPNAGQTVLSVSSVM
jgi:hypothetical protein